MSNSDTYALCAANWSAEADRLMANGWERKDWADSPIPVTFHKEVHGKERVLYLVNILNDNSWWPTPLEIVDP